MRTNPALTRSGSPAEMERWEGFGSLGTGRAIFKQAGHGSPFYPDSDKSSFQHALLISCNQPPAAHPSPAGLGGGGLPSPGESVLPGKVLLGSLSLSPPPATLPEAAASRVNLGQFKESLSGARRMMNVETITGRSSARGAV